MSKHTRYNPDVNTARREGETFGHWQLRIARDEAQMRREWLRLRRNEKQASRRLRQVRTLPNHQHGAAE